MQILVYAIFACIFLVGCTRSSPSIYTVQETDCELGNIMYMDGEDGMYDVWYTGLKLNNGRSTIFIALDGSEPDYDELTAIKVGPPCTIVQ
ncbi:hypothetical protein [Novipirellula artificiosorum]|uniref:Uncharacterized protein n=1 Tax=Novipirellula artificiosorum TaxID=2528016 RepID=A0A5C6DVY9_9BACT|nr:hypothetical protein [Novipirellula artificiosorum]TWU39571.1 hypothetical protein Poly41_24260 [Novipirellula artificiosorum]